MFSLLIVDDNAQFLESAKNALREFNVETCSSIASVKEIIADDTDLVLLDLVFDDNKPDDLQGLELLEYIHEQRKELKVIILTNLRSTEIVVRAIRAGAIDFVNKKDLNWSEWRIRIASYCQSSHAIKQLRKRALDLENLYDPSEIVGTSQEIDYVRNRLRDLAENSDDASIFITGKTGTGKNLAVKYFKRYSVRKDKAYKEFSISELTESLLESELFGHVKGAFTGALHGKRGLFEEADGGILFLDEIGDYDLRIQKKIMRFIEDRAITRVGNTHGKHLDVQLIMATNQDLPRLVAEGKFREDLYQRINRVRIELPSLLDRIEDLPVLVDYFFHHFKKKERTDLKAITGEVYKAFEVYSWPGNVRELQNVIWDACTKARLLKDDNLGVKHLRREIVEGDAIEKSNRYRLDTLQNKIAIIELTEIEEALVKSNGNKSNAAESLHMTLDGVRYKVQKYSRLAPGILTRFQTIKKYYGQLLR